MAATPRWRSSGSWWTPCRSRRSRTPPATSATWPRRTRPRWPARPGSPGRRPTRRPPSASRRRPRLKAQYERDIAIKRAGFLAETEQANARAAQAGPLAEAKATQEVIEQQTALAQRQADLAAQRLEAEVRRPADAEAYRQRTLAEAASGPGQVRGRGEAYRNARWPGPRPRRSGSRPTAPRTPSGPPAGQAEANHARAASLQDGNQELIAANRLVEVLPAHRRSRRPRHRRLQSDHPEWHRGGQRGRRRHRRPRPVHLRHPDPIRSGQRPRPAHRPGASTKP